MNVFITGITGSLGTALAQWHYDRGDRHIFGCARNEKNITESRSKHPWGAGIFCQDAKGISQSFKQIDKEHGCLIDRVYHCAAMKHVEHGEQFPDEAVSQNISVLQAVIAVCRQTECELILPSSDKACLPSNVYGATKLIAERMVICAGHSVVRFGNLLGSSGSVISKWQEAEKQKQPILLTSPHMTRFFVPLRDAAEIMATRAMPGKVIVPEMKTICMDSLADFWSRKKIVGIRPGERLHEWAIGLEEAAELIDGVFVLGDGKVMPNGYCSDDSPRWKEYDFADALAEIDCLPLSAYERFMCG